MPSSPCNYSNSSTVGLMPRCERRATLDSLGCVGCRRLRAGGGRRRTRRLVPMAPHPGAPTPTVGHAADPRPAHHAAGRERVAKAMGYRDMKGSPAIDQFEHDLQDHRSSVRGIHEQLFYRPLLDALAASPTVRLTADEIARQLAAFGFKDVVSARRAVDELTGGLSRRSRLMRQTLPLVLDWLSSAPDPDLGLNQLRVLVTSTTDNAPIIGRAARRPGRSGEALPVAR